MKRLVFALALVAGFAVARAQTPISSVNAAGYIKVTVQPGSFYFLQNPFNKFDGTTPTLDDVVGTVLPDSSEVYVWNGANQTFDISNYIDGLGWLPNLNLPRGIGFFLRAQPGQASYDLFLAGEVPGATSAQTTTLDLVPGFNAVGFPYPVATTLINSGLTQATQEPDAVFLWTGSTYNIANRLDIPGLEWSGMEQEVIQPGAALFVSKGVQQSFVASVPYSWPNN
jgi:hypothetical protein